MRVRLRCMLYKMSCLLIVFLGRLHRGELEVIAGARELEVDYLLIDDRSVRRLAEQILLEPTGLIGLLKIAKILGRVDSLKKCLDILIDNNYRISTKMYRYVLGDVGEDDGKL